MFNLKIKLATAAIAVAAAGAFATPAIAGQCAAPGTNALANAPTMPKGVTDTVIGDINLGSEIGVDGRQLRTRRLVVQPGGIVPLHGVRSKTGFVQATYTVLGPLLPLLYKLFPQYVTTTEQIGRAMLKVAKQGAPKSILETADINRT